MARTAESPHGPAGRVQATSEVEVDDPSGLLALAGPRNEKLKVLQREANVAVGLRGNRVLLEGDAENVALAERFLADAAALLGHGIQLEATDIARALHVLRGEPSVQLRDVFDDVLRLERGRRPVGPRGLAQKRYIESIRAHDLTFGRR